MHELGIVFSIIKTVQNVRKENNVDKVSSVILTLGEVSGVVPSYLKDCWKWAVKKEEGMEDCLLICKIKKAFTICTSCKEIYPTIKYGKICPHCGSDKTYLKFGNEVEIEEITVE